MERIHLLLFFVFLILMQYCWCSTSTNISCHEIERESLLKFRYGLIDKSNRLSSWVGSDCCTWRGVGCSKSTGHVIKLELGLRNPYDYDLNRYFSYFQDHSLGGEVNPSLLNLKHLSYLDLSRNNFSGPIPKFFGSFRDLMYLNLSHSRFSGKVPPHLGNLSSLQYLDISSLQYLDISSSQHLDISSSQYLDMQYLDFSSLQYFDINNNFLSVDSLQWASSLSSLKHLDLSGVKGIGEDSNWLLALNMIPSLRVLNLAECFIATSIPRLSRVNFTSLASLDLSLNQIDSNIPLWLSNLTRLEHLHLQGNNFHGPIPDFHGMASLTILDISVNSFNTSIPESFFNLSSLVHLALRFNEFQGSLPMQIGNLKQLSFLGIGYNQLSGNIPTSLGQLSKLQTLSIECNPLDGNLTENHFTKLKMLKVLDISSTSLGFNLSPQWAPPFQLINLHMESCKNIGPKFPQWLQTQTQLETFSISNSSISDSIPNWFENIATGMYFLDLSDNQISGKLPKLPRTLKYLQMSNNNFTGFISTHICKMDGLVVLNMANNTFSGRLPSCLGSSINLRVLFLTNNKFSGRLPSSLGRLINLRVLDVTDNKFSGRLPSSLGRLINLLFLDVTNNKFSGRLPSSLGRLINLLVLDVTNNKFSGRLPSSLGRLINLSILVLTNNKFSGRLPSSLGRLINLGILDVTNNKFSGRLPSSLGRLINLGVLDVTNNNLHGSLPSSLGSLSNLLSLHLHNNRFEGNLPSSFQKLTALKTLALGANLFTGIIPPWIGEKISNLTRLSLQSNSFDGEIPQQLCHLTSLEILDLAHNRLTGNIPHCIGNLTGMIVNDFNDGDDYEKYYIENIFASVKGRVRLYTKTVQFLTSIDISNNNFVGHIPEGLVDLLGLKALNLSGNQLNGRIPKLIGNLKQLESLDLSRNKLSGPIPPSLSSLYFLSRLNLSFNKLSGRVPTGQQLQTLNDPTIYEGNSGLCGAPGIKSCSGNNEPPPAHESEGSDESDHIWFYAGLSPGFAVGFLGICGVLVFKESWRHAFFQFFENVFNWLALLQRKFHTHQP